MKLRWPDPQFGRLSASSGLAIVTIRIGWFFDHSSIDSMKSSNPGSAHWRSSKTITTVPCSAIRSKKARHAANSSSRSPCGSGVEPEQVREPRLDPPSLVGIGDELGHRRRELAP